jgi:hypothetical protein
MRTQKTPVIAAQAAAVRDWMVSRIRRKPSSGAMHIVRYVFRRAASLVVNLYRLTLPDDGAFFFGAGFLAMGVMLVRNASRGQAVAALP